MLLYGLTLMLSLVAEGAWVEICLMNHSRHVRWLRLTQNALVEMKQVEIMKIVSSKTF